MKVTNGNPLDHPTYHIIEIQSDHALLVEVDHTLRIHGGDPAEEVHPTADRGDVVDHVRPADSDLEERVLGVQFERAVRLQRPVGEEDDHRARTVGDPREVHRSLVRPERFVFAVGTVHQHLVCFVVGYEDDRLV